MQSEYEFFGADNSDAAILSGEPMCPNCRDYGCEYCDQGNIEEEYDDVFGDESPRHCEEIDDGQPSEYDEWQDVFGGDDSDCGQYDGGGEW